jgi:hypothetical protein
MRPVPQRGTGGARGGALYYIKKGFLQSKKLKTVHADAGKVLRNGFDVLYAKGRLHLLKFELVCSIAHIVKDVNGQFLVDLALPQLVDQCRHLLR